MVRRHNRPSRTPLRGSPTTPLRSGSCSASLKHYPTTPQALSACPAAALLPHGAWRLDLDPKAFDALAAAGGRWCRAGCRRAGWGCPSVEVRGLLRRPRTAVSTPPPPHRAMSTPPSPPLSPHVSAPHRRGSSGWWPAAGRSTAICSTARPAAAEGANRPSAPPRTLKLSTPARTKQLPSGRCHQGGTLSPSCPSAQGGHAERRPAGRVPPRTPGRTPMCDLNPRGLSNY